MTDEQMDKRFEALEAKASFQEELLQELNDALIAQQNRIDGLERILEQLISTLESMGGDSLDPEDEPPPPHY